MTDAIRLEGVRRAYGETAALDGVSLTVEKGAVFALVGPNGAGKTTLVRAMTGTTDYDGDVSLFGEDPRLVERSRLGLLPQDFQPHERLTVRELIAYYAGLYDDSRAPGRILTDVGLAESADVAYENLSGGQQRRACVGTALVNDPDLLILDEPTTGIDPAGRRQLWTLLEGLADAGTTIMLTTHYMAEAERLAGRVGLLAEGELVAVDDPASLIADHGGETRLTVEPARPAADREGPDLDYRTAMVDGDLVVYDVSPTEIGSVVDRLESEGIEAASLTWTEPTLEDVYLNLTGQAVGSGGRLVAGDAETEPRRPGEEAMGPRRQGEQRADPNGPGKRSPAASGEGSR